MENISSLRGLPSERRVLGGSSGVARERGVLVNGESLEVEVKVVTDRGLVGVSSIDGGGCGL
jgi:hypothetical protein